MFLIKILLWLVGLAVVFVLLLTLLIHDRSKQDADVQIPRTEHVRLR